MLLLARMLRCLSIQYAIVLENSICEEFDVRGKVSSSSILSSKNFHHFRFFQNNLNHKGSDTQKYVLL